MISTISIDDEPLALQLIREYISKTPFLELKGEYTNPMVAIDHIAREQVELLFLDIEMPDLTGLEFVKAIRTNPKVIFTTAFTQYAIEGFRLDAIDYLLKPFGYDEFLRAAEKARNLISLEKMAQDQVQVNQEYLFLRSEFKVRRINFNDILYIEGMRDYVKVYTLSEKNPILSLVSLRSLISILPNDSFMRVHRSYIVNLEKVNTIERARIVFGEKYIPVSEQYKEDFQKFVDRNFLK